MHKCEFSETQFSFSYTFELIKHNENLLVMPEFLNTVKEGREGGGFDVGFGDPDVDGSLFFQFKIPGYYDRWGWRTKGWDCYHKSFYRIEIDEDQFNLLRALKRDANNVYYATPEFFQASQLQTHYHQQTICEHSALFEIRDFPASLKGFHHIVYRPDETISYLCSEPKDLKKRTFDDFFSFTPDRMKLSQKASILRGIITNTIDIDIPDRIGSVFSALFFRFNVIWIPVLSSH